MKSNILRPQCRCARIYLQSAPRDILKISPVSGTRYRRAFFCQRSNKPIWSGARDAVPADGPQSASRNSPSASGMRLHESNCRPCITRFFIIAIDSLFRPWARAFRCSLIVAKAWLAVLSSTIRAKKRAPHDLSFRIDEVANRCATSRKVPKVGVRPSSNNISGEVAGTAARLSPKHMNSRAISA